MTEVEQGPEPILCTKQESEWRYKCVHYGVKLSLPPKDKHMWERILDSGEDI